MHISNNLGKISATLPSVGGNPTANSAAQAANSKSTSSSITALEAYFEQKIAILKDADLDTASTLELRERIREAAENNNGDSPNLPLIVEHPNGGGSILTNVHLSFGTEIKAQLTNFNQLLQQSVSLNSPNQETTNQPEGNPLLTDNAVIPELAQTVSALHITDNKDSNLAVTLSLSTVLMEEISAAKKYWE